MKRVALMTFGLIAAVMPASGQTTPYGPTNWINYEFRGGFGETQMAKLTSWINDTCRPDDLSSITGFSFQANTGAPLGLMVFCYRGEGKLGKTKVVRADYSGPFLFKMKELKPTSNALVIGFDYQAVKETQPLGQAIMVIKEP